jgi:hypothetical protein
MDRPARSHSLYLGPFYREVGTKILNAGEPSSKFVNTIYAFVWIYTGNC